MKHLLALIFSISLLTTSSGLLAQAPDDSIYTPKNYKEEASFTGGAEAWISHLQNYLDASVASVNGAPAGNYTVIVKFVVMKDGSLRNFTPVTNLGYGMETEVIRVIKSSPNWVPATRNAVAVNAYRMQPVTFIVGKPDKKRNRD